ncbi:MAG: hypothetical protein QM757_28345 [Paludibaculum sp.]
MAQKLYSSDTKCCIEHLVRMGHGILVKGQFIGGGCCTDGQRSRCSTCRKTWEHVCDEAEGCHWVCRSKTQQRQRAIS